MDDTDYTKWMELDENNVKKVYEGRGLYQIRIVRADGSPTKIQRFGRADHEGIIYIGRGDLKTRLQAWLKNGHDGAINWFLAGLFLSQKYRAQFRTKKVRDNNLQDGETEALAKYFRQFAELPPCNSVFSGNKFEALKRYLRPT